MIMHPKDLQRRQSILPRHVPEAPVVSVIKLTMIIQYYTGYSIRDMHKKTRVHDLVIAKQIYQYLLLTCTKIPLTDLKKVAGYHHSTLIYSRSVVESMIEIDREFDRFMTILFYDLITKSKHELMNSLPRIITIKAAWDSRKRMFKVMKQTSSGNWIRFGAKWYCTREDTMAFINRLILYHPNEYRRESEN